MKNELQNIISGKNQVSHGTIIQAAACYLSRSAPTSRMAKKEKHYKTQEAEFLKSFIAKHNLWINFVPLDKYISEGAEQKVYLKDNKTVTKLNDSIYYSCWEDYLHSLLLHNYFFADTAYTLEGFYLESNTMYAVVSQPFVTATQVTYLSQVKLFLEANGFFNNRNHDYFILRVVRFSNENITYS